MKKSIYELMVMNKKASQWFQKSVDKMIQLKPDPNTTSTELQIQRDRIKKVRDDIIVFTGAILDKCNEL